MPKDRRTATPPVKRSRLDETEGLGAVHVGLPTLLALASAVLVAGLTRRLLRRSREELRLRDVALSITGTTGAEEALARAVESAVLSPGDSAYVERIDRERHEVQVVVAAGGRAPPPGTSFPFPGSLTEKALRTGESEIVTGVSGEDGSISRAVSECCPDCTALILLLTSGSVALGALVILRPASRGFRTDELLRPRILGSITALALRETILLEETERRRREVEESEARFRAIFEEAGIGAALVGMNGRVIDANPVFLEMLGYTEEELRGKHFGEITHPDDLAVDQALYEEMVAGRRHRYQIEKRYLKRGGEVIWGQLTISLVRDGRGEPLYAVGMVEDVTERKRTAAALRREAERRNAIIATQQEIARARPDLETVLQVVAERTQALTGASGAAVEIAEGDTLVYRATSGSLAPYAGLRHEIASGLSGLAVRTGQVHRSDDTEKDERVSVQSTRRVGARSMIAVPLFYRGETIGALEVAAKEANAFDDRDVDALQLMAELIAAAMARAAELEAERALVEERTVALERQRFLTEASQVLVASIEYEKTLRRVAALAVPFLADLCLVDVAEDRQIHRIASAHADPAKEALAHELERFPPLPGSQHPTVQVMRTGRPRILTVDDRVRTAIAQSPEHLRVIQQLAPRSVMFVPLRARGRTLGAIQFVVTSSDRRYGPDDLALAEDLAGRAALAIDNARLFEESLEARGEAERRAREEEALREAAGAVSTAFTTEETTRRIAESALVATNADGAFVERVDLERAEVEVVAAAGEKVPPIGSRGPYPGSFVEAVLERKEPELIVGLGETGDTVPDYLKGICEGCSVAVVPLIDAGEPVGSLTLVRRAQKQAFRLDEVERAYTFGDLAALAFRKIHMLEESERKQEDLLRVTESRARLMRGFSHDVKNPLGAVDGQLQLLEEGILDSLTEKQKRSVARARRSVRSALELIDDLLEVARAESGRIEIEHAPTDVWEAAREIAEDYRAQAEAEGLTIEIVRPDEFPLIESDPSRIRQVLSNLLSNAVKYTPRGGRITVRAAVREGRGAPGPGRWVAVDVSDTGPGIPEEKQRFLFQEFSRLEPGTRRGTGVGLAMSKRIAHALDGDITVRSEVGEGSTFTLWLPGPPGANEAG